MPEFNFWPIGASLVLMLVAVAAFVVWRLVQSENVQSFRSRDLECTINASVSKNGPHDLLLDTRLPTGHRLIVLRTPIDNATVYTASIDPPEFLRFKHGALVDGNQPAILELGPIDYPSVLGLPQKRLTINLIDNPNDDAAPVRRWLSY